MSNPNDYNFWFQKAMSGGRFIEDIQRSLRLNPYHFDSWIYYAGYYASSVNENDKTVEVINQLLKYETKPDISPSLFEHVLKKIEKYTDDDAPLKKIKPNTPYWDNRYEKRYCGEWLIAATYYWKKQEFNKAYDAFKKAISYPRNKNKALLWYIYLVLSLASKEYSKAIEYGEQAIELDSEFKYAWHQLGKAYLYRGDYNQATNCLEMILSLDKNFEPALDLKEKINLNIEEVHKLEGENIYLYQRQYLSKEERDFLLELEKECEKPIPKVKEIKWDDVIPRFGFTVKDDHIVELGLTLEAHSIKFIPESIKNLTHLELLVIKGIHNLQKFPESIIYLKNLKYLRYEHCPMPYNPGLSPNSIPKIICNLMSLEKLHLDESSITTLLECLIFLPNLNEINILCPNLKTLPPIIKEYFEYQEYQRPFRRYLIRKKKPPEVRQITPKEIYNQFLLKTKSTKETLEELISIIEKSDLLERRIESIKLLKKLSSKSEHEFRILEKILKTDPYILIRNAASNVILNKYSDIAFESIKYVLMNDKSLDVINFIREFIRGSDSTLSKLIKKEFLDFLIIKDIEKLIGQRLPEISNFEVIKNKFHKIHGPHGYIKKGNRITHLSLLINSPVWQHDPTSIPTSIGELNELEGLKLINCRKLKNLPEEIGNLKKLRKLVCIDCRSLESLPDKLGNLENLECLKLVRCYSLRKIPSTISKLKNLKVLDLSECWSLKNIPENLKGLDSLKLIKLENCISLHQIPKSIISLLNLEEINLKKCRTLEKLPDDIGNSKALKILNLRSCTHLKEIPKSIGNLQNQKELDLSYCYFLTDLPKTIGNLKGLQKLILRGCRALEVIPESIGDLKQLEELNLFACLKLKSLPNNIGKLSNLKKLELSYCESLNSLPNTMENLERIEYVYLDHCTSLVSIPDNILYLNKLRKLTQNTLSITPLRKNSIISGLDLELKNYQVKRNSELKNVSIILTEKIQNLVKNGVNLKDAEILVKFFRFLDCDLPKSEIYEDLDEDQDDMYHLHHFKINSSGRVTELHLHCTDAKYLSIFPEYLCSLECLEVIRCPNNLIEIIPDCIKSLKSLRVLELRNIELSNPIIPNSLECFIKSLEIYNEF